MSDTVAEQTDSSSPVPGWKTGPSEPPARQASTSCAFPLWLSLLCPSVSLFFFFFLSILSSSLPNAFVFLGINRCFYYY